MQQARIVMVSDVLSRSAAGVVYGPISLQLNGLNFPDANWTDFVVVVLSWWCQAVLRLLQGESGPVEVRYMEGPFLVEVSTSATRTWHMSLVDVGLRRRIRHSADIDANPFLLSILEASDRTLAACRRQGWSSPDMDELALVAKSLRNKMGMND